MWGTICCLLLSEWTVNCFDNVHFEFAWICIVCTWQQFMPEMSTSMFFLLETQQTRESKNPTGVQCRSWPEPSPTTPVGIPWLIGWSRMELGLGLVLAACRCFEKTHMYHNICQRMKVWLCYVFFNESMIMLCVVQWNLLVVFWNIKLLYWSYHSLILVLVLGCFNPVDFIFAVGALVGCQYTRRVKHSGCTVFCCRNKDSIT